MNSIDILSQTTKINKNTIALGVFFCLFFFFGGGGALLFG